MRTIIFFFILAIGMKAYSFETDERMERNRMMDEAENSVSDSKFTRKEIIAENGENYREVASERNDKWFNDMEELMVDPKKLDDEPEYR